MLAEVSQYCELLRRELCFFSANPSLVSLYVDDKIPCANRFCLAWNRRVGRFPRNCRGLQDYASISALFCGGGEMQQFLGAELTAEPYDIDGSGFQTRKSFGQFDRFPCNPSPLCTEE